MGLDTFRYQISFFSRGLDSPHLGGVSNFGIKPLQNPNRETKREDKQAPTRPRRRAPATPVSTCDCCDIGEHHEHRHQRPFLLHFRLELGDGKLGEGAGEEEKEDTLPTYAEDEET